MISIIIPTYNRAGVLENSIKSVLDQTYTDIELIVADDCSTDNTNELVNRIRDNRLKYVCLEKNMGACAARNAGIRVSQGELIAFQDSDDVWAPEKLERILSQFDQDSVDVCFHRLRRHYPNTAQTKLFPDLENSRFVSHEEICNYAMISTQTIVGKREVFLEHAFDPNVKKSQDYDWAIRASRNYRFYYINEVLVEQYYQNDSISQQGLRTIKEMRQYFLKKYPEEVKENPQFELYQLQIIARNKTILGEAAAPEYKRIYELRHTKRDLVKYYLSRLHLLSVLYRIKGDYRKTLPGD